MKQTMLMAAAVCLMAACGVNNNTKQQSQMETPTNTQKAVALLKAIETGETEPIGYVNANNYKQHNLTVADGLDGFGAALAGLADYPEKTRVNTVRAFADGNYVICHTDYNFYGPKAGFDIFRFDQGKIVEHWDNLMPYDGTPNPSGHTPFDGTTEITNLDQTEANKTLVRSFVEDVLMGKHPEKFTTYFNGNNYIQHNTGIADGLDGLGAALAAMAEQGIVMQYDTIHHIFGCGNFVLAVSEGAFGGEPTSFYDLFRVDGGKIAEHWDVIEPLAPRDQWKHQNGKFGF